MFCEFCGADISHLALAQVQTEIDGRNFCGAVCAEEWLDQQQRDLLESSLMLHGCDLCGSAVGPGFEDIQDTEEGAAYLNSLDKHIHFVREAGAKLGVPNDLLLRHDATKSSVYELSAYVKNFQGGGDPVGFPFAWLHHIHHNPHHWQHWLFGDRWARAGSDIVDGALPMPEVFAKEMVADWMGSSMAYTGAWDMSAWLTKNIPRIRLHPKTATFVGKVLSDLGYKSIVARVRFPCDS